MKSKSHKIALMLMLMGICSCGLKGPLYFPKAENKDTSEQKHEQSSPPPVCVTQFTRYFAF
ncbi:LPS translocon maturation chaperone LptM [Sodalis endosymbiont of Henestaris halophilus]|uniref:LPS translocon maturation chaperone LptM n=1 Tax=Sodalis endosymbiont of Henestaris halophilus TaxID=1929246 RepID=UPI0012FDF942|nr:lipoprotein [Sodalis endosymbiont of Henestaris halophilus]